MTTNDETVSGRARSATSWRMIPVLKNSSRTSTFAPFWLGRTAVAPALSWRSGPLPSETFFLTILLRRDANASFLGRRRFSALKCPHEEVSFRSSSSSFARDHGARRAAEARGAGGGRHGLDAEGHDPVEGRHEVLRHELRPARQAQHHHLRREVARA